jgi:hypothetical protein
MRVVKEPQGVEELMARTEAAWQRQIDACDDATGPARIDLRDALAALRTEYGDADYPRREVIERELRDLIRRHDALSAREAADAPAPHDPVPLGVEAARPPEERDGEPEAEPEPAVAIGSEAEAVPGAAEAVPHAPVPLGVEAAPPVGEREADAALEDVPEEAPVAVAEAPDSEAVPGAAREAPVESLEAEIHFEPAPHSPVPLGAEAAPSRGGRDTAPGRTPRPGPSGPVPHGAPGPSRPVTEEAADAGSDPDTGAEPDGGWTDRRGRVGWGGRWWAVARLTLAYELLLRKRQARQMELGVRVWQLSRRDELGDAAADAGVTERLRQIERVEDAIRANRDRYRAVRRGSGG